MNTRIASDRAVVRAPQTRGSHYRCYPDPSQFDAGFDELAYRAMAALSNEDPIPRPLALDLCIPPFLCGGPGDDKIAPLLTALAREIALQAELFDADRRVGRLRLGGGASCLNEQQRAELVSVLAGAFDLEQGAGRDFALETEPHRLTPPELAPLGALGFNRLSLCVRAFDLATGHQPTLDRLRALREAAGSAGLTVGIELSGGAPHSAAAVCGRVLDELVALLPERLVLSPLPQRPRSGPAAGSFDRCLDRLSAAGYAYLGQGSFALQQDSLARALAASRLGWGLLGYSDQPDCDVIGLGPAAIGHLADSYCQNTTGAPDYCRRLARDQLPVARGVALSGHDLLHGGVIMALLCQGELDFGDFERRLRVHFRSYFREPLARLAPLAEAGLLLIDAQGLRLSEHGRLFAVEVCEAFDAYLRPASASVRAPGRELRR